MIKQVLFPLLLLLTIVSCDENRVYEKNQELENKIWIADSVLNFQFEIKHPDQPYNILYNLRNSVAYPFQNIYVNYTLEDTLGNTIRKDLINKDLFHPKTGKPYGNGLGDVFDHQLSILENYKFDEAGTYNIKLEQFMRRDTLPEILSVGIRIEKASNSN